MPRFVILEHDHPRLHWDLMLEHEGALRTWRLASAPTRPGDVIDAEALGDHRLAYLDYEGAVSGERGTVTRWDGGDYEGAPVAGGMELTLRGERVRGHAKLTEDSGRWTFEWAT